MDVEIFDMNNFWVYLIYILLIGGLFALRLPAQDTLFILINVVIYTAITSFIFYFHTKYEEKRIKGKYLKNMLSIIHDMDPSSYETNKYIMMNETKRKKKVTFLNHYATIIVAMVFLFMSLVYFVRNSESISVAKVVENSYYLSILGMTEIFVTFFVMSRMPYPDIFNLIDAIIRRKELCSVDNAVKLSGPGFATPIPGRCDSFSKDGDVCNTLHEGRVRTFTCVDGYMTRKTASKS